MTDNNVAKIKQLPPPEPNMVERAIAAGASIEVIEKVMGMQERWEANQAKKAFNSAIAAFKADPPEILKTSEVKFDSQRTGGKTSYKYEDLADMLAQIDPALAEHGLWIRFKVNSEPGLVTVTCVVGHQDGYSEEASTLQGAPDTSGNKNAIQAIGSTVSYLQRYTAKAALGMAAARDDDGRRSGAQVLTQEQVDQVNKALLAAGKKVNVDKFLDLAGAQSVSDILAIKFPSCMAYIQRQVEKVAKK